MTTRRQRWGIAVATMAVIAAVIAAVVAADPTGRGSAAPAARSPAASVSPVRLLRVGGLPVAVPTDRTIHDPTLLPYPFMSPTPSPTVSVIDGTYLRTLTLRDVGGARIGLPYRCFRCPPYRIDAGVSTLVFTRGAYYVHHQISGFRTMGSFVVDGDRLTMFNDANCPQTPGTYELSVSAHGLRLRVIADDCPFGGERADDLTVVSWTRVPVCIRRIRDLWPGEVAC